MLQKRKGEGDGSHGDEAIHTFNLAAPDGSMTAPAGSRSADIHDPGHLSALSCTPHSLFGDLSFALVSEPLQHETHDREAQKQTHGRSEPELSPQADRALIGAEPSARDSFR